VNRILGPDQWRDYFGVDKTITVSMRTQRGRTKLHTFALIDGQWVTQVVATSRQLRAGWTFGRKPNSAPGAEPDDQLPLSRTGRSTIPLAPGVDPQARVLATILDALLSGSRHHVDLDDLKVVLSQLGSYITQFCSLAPEQHQDAEPALHAEILRRCATVD
jgi:hypothetical protein